MMECTVEFCHPCLISLCLASGTEPSQPTTVLPVKTDLEASKISHIINSSMASVLLFLPSYIPTVSPPCSPYFCDTVLIPLTIRYVVLDINEFWSGGLLRCSVSLMQLKINILSAAWGFAVYIVCRTQYQHLRIKMPQFFQLLMRSISASKVDAKTDLLIYNNCIISHVIDIPIIINSSSCTVDVIMDYSIFHYKREIRGIFFKCVFPHK